MTVIIRGGQEDPVRVAGRFVGQACVDGVVAIAASDAKADGVEVIATDAPHGSLALRRAFAAAKSDYVLLVDADGGFELGQYALERLTDVADQTGAGLVYSDYRVQASSGVNACPVIDYQLGAVRDDFNFGPIRLYSRAAIARAWDTGQTPTEWRFSAEYDLRLRIAKDAAITRLPESLYTLVRREDQGDAHWDYVDPRNAEVQKEREEVFTEHLKRIGAYLEPDFKPVPAEENPYEVEASIVIPVLNRERTIMDAVRSGAGQAAPFPFNIIVVDNHSTDRTTQLLADFAAKDSHLVHVVPERTDLGIGGCLNEAIRSPHCGRFVVQLDSDDLYPHEHVLEQIVAKLKEGPHAMVVGSYRIVDFDLNEIPPGVVDHREWTAENGHNNVLRVNGFGAPRAFHTQLLRRHPFPNVSYGEDYAMGLRICRTYALGRLWEPIYLCRRWEDNSDAALPVTKLNAYNVYKDRIRTVELLARLALNRGELA